MPNLEFETAALELKAAADALARCSPAPVQPGAEYFNAVKQAIRNLSIKADALVTLAVSEAESATHIRFFHSDSAIQDSMDDATGYLGKAADEAEWAGSREAADANRGDRAFHEVG